MKKIGLLFLLLIPQTGLLVAQEAPAFQLKEQRGIRLNDKNLALLLDKTWTSYKQYEVTNGQAKLQNGNFFSLKINNDSSCYISGTRSRQNGTWAVNGKQLQLNLNKKDEAKADFSMEGTYLIYALTEDEMVLVKEIGGTPALVCYCKSSVVKELDNSPIVSANKENKEKAQKVSLAKEIEMELFLRGEKLKIDLEGKNVSELKQVRDLVMKGKFSKEEILRSELMPEMHMRGIKPPADFGELSYGKLKKLKKQILANKYQAN